jgi:hypothetical protein
MATTDLPLKAAVVGIEGDMFEDLDGRFVLAAVLPFVNDASVALWVAESLPTLVAASLKFLDQ